MKTKQDVIQWLEENQDAYVQMADYIWACAEPAYKEFKSSKYQADFLEEQGFSVKWDIGGVNTAFVAEWGDRSQIATIALGSSKNPLGVTIGGLLGHAICTASACIGGRMLASSISEKQVSLWGGVVFLLFGVHSLFFEE